MAARQPPSNSHLAVLTLSLLVGLFGSLCLEVRTQSTHYSGSTQQDTQGLSNVYFIPAYRVATNRTLKAPPSNAAIVIRPAIEAPTLRSSTSPEKSAILNGASSDIFPERQLPQQPAAYQKPSVTPNSQTAAIAQYLLGFTNAYQQPNRYQQYNRYQQPIAQQQQQYSPIPQGYFPFRTSSSPQQHPGYFPFPPVYIPPSIIPKSATEPPPLPPINLNTGNYRPAASMNDVSVIKSAQISVTSTLATAGPIYETAADDMNTTTEAAQNSTVPDMTITLFEEETTNDFKKSTTVPPKTPKTFLAPTSTTTAPIPDSKTSPSSGPEETTSPSQNIKSKKAESNSTEKALAEQHRFITRHFEFSEDKEHSQVNATGDIRLTASRKTSSEDRTSQNTPNALAAQGLNSVLPTLPSLPLNTPHPHSHPHPAIIQGPNGFFVGSYDPMSQVGVIPPPSNDPYAYVPFGHSAALSQSAYPIHPTVPTHYEGLYYGFAPGFPFGVPPATNVTALQQPRPVQQQAQPHNTQPPLYNPGNQRQLFDVTGPRPYPLSQQVPYAPFQSQPFQPPGSYPRFSNGVLQSPVERQFYSGDPSLTNRGYLVPETRPSRLPNQVYGGQPSGPSVPSRLYNPDSGTDQLLNREFGGGASPFISPGFVRSDNAGANSGLSNFVSPVRGSGSAYEIKPGSENTVDSYDRRDSSRESDQADVSVEQVVY